LQEGMSSLYGDRPTFCHQDIDLLVGERQGQKLTMLNLW
jgi:hypothetical protein